MIEIDKVSQSVSADTDVTMADLENQVAAQGYTLNYHAAPHNRAMLAEVLERRIPNAFAEAFGGIDDLCIQALWAQPDGSVFTTTVAPRSATGPDFKKLAIGACGELGVPIRATLKLFRAPPCRRLACVLFPDLKHLDLCRRGLAKLPFRLPLARLLPSRACRDFFPAVAGDPQALGLGLWGETGLVEAQVEAVFSEAEKKKGEPYLVEDAALGKKLWTLLVQAAAVPLGEDAAWGEEAPAKNLAQRILQVR